MPIIMGNVSTAIAVHKDPTVKSREDLLMAFLSYSLNRYSLNRFSKRRTK
jgi:hypothetical protein